MKVVFIVMLVMSFISPSFRDMTYQKLHESAVQVVNYADSMLESNQ